MVQTMLSYVIEHFIIVYQISKHLDEWQHDESLAKKLLNVFHFMTSEIGLVGSEVAFQQGSPHLSQ